MREVDIERTAYPQLPLNITDREVIERYTLEPEELSLVRGYRGDSLTFAIRLKVFGHLLSHNLPLSEVPQRVVDYIASQFQEKPETLSESKDSRYEQIKLIREYTGFSPFTKEEYDKLSTWLIAQAEKQFHLLDLVNDAIFHLMEIKVELPSFQRLLRLTAHALRQSDIRQRELLSQSIDIELKEKLDALLKSECQYQRTPFYELKEPPENPSSTAIVKEIQLLQRLRSFNLSFDVLEQVNNDKIKHFFEIAKSYKSNELFDLVPSTRYPILLCFIYMRIKEVTDNIVELFLRLWNQIAKDALRAQDDYILKRAEAKQQGEDLYEQLLEIIVESSSKDEIVDNIFALHSYEEYKSLLSTLRQLKKPKKVKYFETIQAKYSFVRRFTPLIWENLTFKSNTSDDTLVRAIEYLKENLEPSIPELPVSGAPVDFRGTRKILSINKSMYELSDEASPLRSEHYRAINR
jgi:hypothetical protein